MGGFDLLADQYLLGILPQVDDLTCCYFERRPLSDRH